MKHSVFLHKLSSYAEPKEVRTCQMQLPLLGGLSVIVLDDSLQH